MQAHQAVDRAAERRLAAVGEPLVRRQRAEIRPPDAVDEARLVGKRHAARRRAEDQRQTPARIGMRAARSRRKRAGRAGMGVDQPGADRRPGRKPIAAAASAVSPARAACPARRLGADAGVTLGGEELEADAVEKFVRPARLMREIANLQVAVQAERRREPVARKVRKSVRSKKCPARSKFRACIGRAMQLRRMHLRRNLAADIAQDVMAAGIDPLGLIHGAMIHPDDHVALRRIGRAHRQGTRIAVERDQRAGRVEADAANALGGRPDAWIASRTAP